MAGRGQRRPQTGLSPQTEQRIRQYQRVLRTGVEGKIEPAISYLKRHPEKLAHYLEPRINTKPHVKRLIVNAFAELGEQGRRIPRTAVKNIGRRMHEEENPEGKREAAIALLKINKPECFEHFISALENPNVPDKMKLVCIEGIKNLAGKGNPEKNRLGERRIENGLRSLNRILVSWERKGIEENYLREASEALRIIKEIKEIKKRQKASRERGRSKITKNGKADRRQEDRKKREQYILTKKLELARMGREDRQKILQYLERETEPVRAFAASKAAELGFEEAIPSMFKLLNEAKEPDSKLSVALSLVRLVSKQDPDLRKEELRKIDNSIMKDPDIAKDLKSLHYLKLRKSILKGK